MREVDINRGERKRDIELTDRNVGYGDDEDDDGRRGLARFYHVFSQTFWVVW